MTGHKTDCRVKQSFKKKRQKLKDYWIHTRSLGSREEAEVKEKRQAKSMRRERS